MSDKTCTLNAAQYSRLNVRRVSMEGQSDLVHALHLSRPPPSLGHDLGTQLHLVWSIDTDDTPCYECSATSCPMVLAARARELCGLPTEHTLQPDIGVLAVRFLISACFLGHIFKLSLFTSPETFSRYCHGTAPRTRPSLAQRQTSQPPHTQPAVIVAFSMPILGTH
jgi:hypothetical protein